MAVAIIKAMIIILVTICVVRRQGLIVQQSPVTEDAMKRLVEDEMRERFRNAEDQQLENSTNEGALQGGAGPKEGALQGSAGPKEVGVLDISSKKGSPYLDTFSSDFSEDYSSGLMKDIIG